MEGVAGEEDHHDDQEEQGEENAEAEGQHDEHDEDGETLVAYNWSLNFMKSVMTGVVTCLCLFF